MSFNCVYLGQDVFFVISSPVVYHVDICRGAKMFKNQEAMFRLRVVLLFTSLDKCFGGGRFCSDNET